MLVAGCLFAGALIGFTGGVLGIGGGLLAIPLLGLAFDMSQQMAQGTAMIMVLPAVLMSIRQYNRYAQIDLKAAAVGGLASVACTWLGARVALGMDPAVLRVMYAGFVFCIAIFYFHQSTRRPARARSGARRRPLQVSRLWFAGLGMLAGTTGGIFGVGGSIMIVPLLTTVLRYSQTGAQALALTMIVPGAAVALATYTFHGEADWLIGLPLAVGSILMVPYGVRLAYALPEPRLKLVFACMLLIIMVLLLFKA